VQRHEERRELEVKKGKEGAGETKEMRKDQGRVLVYFLLP
jgi:hypothetical protein